MGFRVVAYLAPDAPRWASAGHGYAETANLRPIASEYGKFAAAVARRYSGGYQGLPKVGLVLDLERAQPQPVPEAARRRARALPRDGGGGASGDPLQCSGRQGARRRDRSGRARRAADRPA